MSRRGFAHARLRFPFGYSGPGKRADRDRHSRSSGFRIVTTTGTAGLAASGSSPRQAQPVEQHPDRHHDGSNPLSREESLGDQTLVIFDEVPAAVTKRPLRLLPEPSRKDGRPRDDPPPPRNAMRSGPPTQDGPRPPPSAGPPEPGLPGHSARETEALDAFRPGIEITVAICTRNRAGLLRQTLERMSTGLRVPTGLRWELLLIDNGSGDSTRVVAGEFAGRLPLRVVEEPTVGLASARNRAVGEARGRYLVWTDDDVLVDEAWLEAYLLAFRRSPDTGFFGGPIEPWFASEPPRWLRGGWHQVSDAFALRDGISDGEISPGHLPYGANVAFRLEDQRRFRYDTALGHRGEERIGGEETALIRAMLAAGIRGEWVPTARVHHFVPAERLTTGYLRSYFLGRGQRLRIDPEPGRAARYGWAGRVLQWSIGLSLYASGLLLSRPNLWLRGLRMESIARGYLVGPRAQRRPRPQASEANATAGKPG